MTGPVKVGVIGAGNISDQYLGNLVGYPDVEVVAVADLDTARAREQATKYGVASAGTVAELLARPDIELVLNLTIPRAHAEVAMAVVKAGKHLWGEKPITMDRASARSLLDAARARGVLVGNAPDTVLGDGIQTSRRLLEAGRIGTPQTVLTIMQGPGPDAWHPRPRFLFARGAGPLFDIGPYHVATMVHLLGPIAAVQASGHRARAVRTVGSGPDAGTTFPVEVHTHVSVLIRFESGVVGTTLLSFDSPLRRQTFEITGSEGTLKVPVDSFDGASEVLPAGSADQVWERVGPDGEPRGFGVGALEMARALRSGQTPRASGDLAYHVLDAMLAVEESIDSGVPVKVDSSFEPTPVLPAGWDTRERTL